MAKKLSKKNKIFELKAYLEKKLFFTRIWILLENCAESVKKYKKLQKVLKSDKSAERYQRVQEVLQNVLARAKKIGILKFFQI